LGVSKINLNDKQRVITSQLHLVERQASQRIFTTSLSSNYDNHYLAIDEYAKLNFIYGYDFHIARNINKAYYSRVHRLKHTISKIVLSGNAYFITLTFDDDALFSTNETTRRKNVSRYLKTISNDYVANVDYGTDKGREHYHAVLSLPEGKNSLKWAYGFYKVVKIGKRDSDIVKISKYISKLTNHAIKETTRSSRIIYSRNIDFATTPTPILK
jgi:hypothetical protein